MQALSVPRSTADLQVTLQKAVSPLSGLSSCALLNYPDYPNIGDHLIWAGTVMLLKTVMGVDIRYVASIQEFSEQQLHQKANKLPILLQGGGNFGDLWPHHQKFRERIVQTYPDRPIFVLPQSIYFQSSDKLQHAAQIFNAHPNLTLFVRDRRSYDIAQQAFHQCQVILSPDMAFQLTQLRQFPVSTVPMGTLYHCRQDDESNGAFTPDQLNLPSLSVHDWISYERNWQMQLTEYRLKRWAINAYREVWQRRLGHPQEWKSLQLWARHYTPDFSDLDRPDLHRQSWSFIHSGIYQLRQYAQVITNRLHGHILCTLLDIPHLFLPNSYYKNQAYYQAWTRHLSGCQFIAASMAVAPALTALRQQQSPGRQHG